VGTRRRRTYRNLGVEDSGDPLPDWFFMQGVELVVDHCVRPPQRDTHPL